MSQPWFNAETGTLLLDEYVAQRPSFRKVMEDSVVTDEEVTEQAHRVLSLLRKLEEMLTPEARSVATDALCELAVLYALERHHHISIPR
jgi:hypothetical protein